MEFSFKNCFTHSEVAFISEKLRKSQGGNFFLPKQYIRCHRDGGGSENMQGQAVIIRPNTYENGHKKF
jgi:hypothetical protein